MCGCYNKIINICIVNPTESGIWKWQHCKHHHYSPSQRTYSVLSSLSTQLKSKVKQIIKEKFRKGMFWLYFWWFGGCIGSVCFIRLLVKPVTWERRKNWYRAARLAPLVVVVCAKQKTQTIKYQSNNNNNYTAHRSSMQKMDKNDSFSSVEKELERVLSKFTTIRSFSERVLGDVATEMTELKDSIAEGKST